MYFTYGSVRQEIVRFRIVLCALKCCAMVTPLVNTNYAEDIYFFSANVGKCISSSVLKSPMFSTHDMKYIWHLL